MLLRWNKNVIGDNLVWKVSIGLPNGTGLWQVSDLSQQNGSWKMGMKKEKDALIKFKEHMELLF